MLLNVLLVDCAVSQRITIFERDLNGFISVIVRVRLSVSCAEAELKDARTKTPARIQDRSRILVRVVNSMFIVFMDRILIFLLTRLGWFSGDSVNKYVC